MKLSTSLGLFSVCFALEACDAESQARNTGGLSLQAADAGSDAGAPSPRGFAVVNSDRASASVSLLSISGEVESASFISSASEDPGLSLALGADLVLPTMRLPGPELVLIDRFPAAVLSWVSLETAEVRAQLSVATGFSSNPHDYVPYSNRVAFVPRFGGNADSGSEPFDSGDDVLVIDPQKAEIVDTIDLRPAFEDEGGQFLPRGDRAFLAGGLLRVLAIGLTADFTDRVDSRLVSIEPDSRQISDVLLFDDMTSCASAAVSPDGSQLAVACNGAFGQDPGGGYPDSGILIVSVEEEPRELERFTASDLGVVQINNLEWADDSHIAFLTFGRYNEDRSDIEENDAARIFDVRDGSVSEPFLEAGPFNLGDIVCAVSERRCLVADAETGGGRVHVLNVDDGAVHVEDAFAPDPQSGLPPRSFGLF